MEVRHHHITVSTHGQGTYEVTEQIAAALRETKLKDGMVHVFCRHTSCSLVIMENADPSARQDLHYFFDKLVPDDDPNYTHTLEGPDDMTSHIKMALTRTTESVPFERGKLLLGTWQGLFLWEHRDAAHQRQLVISVLGS